jgi:hypothetical protein
VQTKNIKGSLLMIDGTLSKVKSVVHYAGIKTYNLCITSGFGASETQKHIEIKEDEFEEWLEKHTYKTSKPVIEKTMENSKNNFTEMRSFLFTVMRDLRNDKVKVDKAKAICGVAQTIINSVKAEGDYIKASGSGQKPAILS